MQVLGYPATWPTSCFIDGGCGISVFAHTNGFGDFVLFDDLGPPWPIHECYLNRFSFSSQRGVTILHRTAVFSSAQVPGAPQPTAVKKNNIRRVSPESLLGKGSLQIAGYVQDYVERRADKLAKNLGPLGQQLFRAALGTASSQLTVITTEFESYTLFADLSQTIVRPKDMIVASIRSVKLMGVADQTVAFVASHLHLVRLA